MQLSDDQVIRDAILQWRNHIQTGDRVLCCQNLVDKGLPKLCRTLNSEQQEFVIRLEELAERFK